MNDRYKKLLQRRLCITAIGPSTVRGMGPIGTMKKFRDTLTEIDMNHFKDIDCNDFKEILDYYTKKFTGRELGKTIKGEMKFIEWGAARKCINIFLRDCLYNRWICEIYNIDKIESFLEVPLDSHVYKGIKREMEKFKLIGELDFPVWTGVSQLSQENSSKYQHIAKIISDEQGIARVHLDLEFWNSPELEQRGN